jgi:hypothetical protein
MNYPYLGYLAHYPHFRLLALHFDSGYSAIPNSKYFTDYLLTIDRF